MQVQLADNAEFSYRVERSAKRRTVSIQIDAGEVVVRAPKNADELWISRWVHSKAEWIYPRLCRQRDQLDEHRTDPSSGEITLFGQPFRLEHSSKSLSPEQRLDRAKQVVLLSGRDSFADKSVMEQRLKRLLREAAKPILTQMTERLAEDLGLHPDKVSVRHYKRKWGQCSSTREITLNWRIIHLPTKIQEYVIVHELCHLQEMNHSSRFWSLVAQHCPDYQARREQLKQYGAYLMW